MLKKKELGELIVKYKVVYDKELKNLESKTYYDYKRKKCVPMKRKQGLLATAVREFYIDLSKVKHDDPGLAKYLANYFLQGEEPTKNKFRENGGGRKSKASKVKEAMFE